MANDTSAKTQLDYTAGKAKASKGKEQKTNASAPNNANARSFKGSKQ